MAEGDTVIDQSKKSPLAEAQESKVDNASVSIPATSPPIIAASLAVLILVLLFSTGWINVLLVLLCSTLLLLNPWVRTFLELPSVSDSTTATRSNLATYDPARFLNFTSAKATPEAIKEQASSSDTKPAAATAKRPLDRTEAYAALRRMPSYLRTPIADLEELIIRDCISSWYDFHSFGEQSLPNQARYSIDHAVGSVYATLENVRSTDVVSDVLLTSSSVLLTTLRARRLYPGRSAIFSSDTARISALREALDRLLTRHLKGQDADCDLLKVLLREILCKQFWNAICSIGEPDFINRSIVVWGENQRAKENAEPATYSEEPNVFPKTPQLSVPTGTMAGQAPPPQSHSPTKPFRHATDSFVEPYKSSKVPPSPGVEGFGPVTRAPSTPVTATAPRGEPLTIQPRAVVMPSPGYLSLNSSQDRLHSPFMSSSPVTSNPPPLPRRPLSDQRNTDEQEQSPQVEAFHSQGNSSPQPPLLPPRKDTRTSEETAWSLLPMDVPPEVQNSTTLPDSLHKSLKSNVEEEATEGYRLSIDSTRELKSPMLTGGRSHFADYEGGSLYASSSKGDEASGQSSVDSQLYQARSRPASRPASRGSGSIPPAPDLAEVLSSTNSPSLSALRDAFEAFLERGGATSRSLFFSPPSAATVVAGEGMTLLKLHYGLATIAKLVPNETSDEDEVFREDAFNTTLTALQSLNQADDSIAGRPLREALLVAAQRLETEQNSRVREILRPVELTLWSRLLGLYDHFWKETCTRPAGSRPSVISPSLSSSSRTSFSANRQSGERARPTMEQLHYQPRKKLSTNVNSSAPMSKSNSRDNSESNHVPRPDSTPPVQSAALTESTDWQTEAPSLALPSQSGPPPIPPRKEQVSRPVPRRAEVQPLDDQNLEDTVKAPEVASAVTAIDYEAQSSIEITATDVSTNADRPTMSVDIRTYEVMIAVEGLVAGGGGFVLLRTWKDLQQMEDQLKASDGSELQVFLPSVKGQTSLTLTKSIEDYLVKLLSTPALVESEAVQHFVDKRRAGEPASNRSTLLMDSLRLSNRGLGLGKTFANGVGVVGKNAFSTLQMMPSNVAALSKTATRSLSSSPEKGAQAQLEAEEPIERAVPLQKEEEEKRSIMLPPPPPPPPRPSETPTPLSMNEDESEMSPQELDNLLSCFFAIADEAFNLSGGWTLRRGLLRVLEQVVRTQYWSSIMGMFHNLSHSLNQEQIASWIVQLKEKFWPDEVGSTRTDQRRTSSTTNATAEQANHPSDPSSSKDKSNVEETAAELVVEAVEETGEERSSEEKLACHLKAKSIFIAQTPVGSAYFLGPGGKQSCEKALNLLHEEITKPETSLDLVLTVILKMCDMVS